MSETTKTVGVTPSEAAIKSRQRPKKDRFPAPIRVLEHSWLIVLVLAVWWLATERSTNFFVPPLSRILEVAWRDVLNGVVLNNAIYSLTNLAAGLGLALVVGVVLGIAIGETKRLREIVDPVLHFFRSIPQSALVPLIIGAFGLGQGPKIYTIAFATVWPILLNTIDGVLGVEPTVRSFAKVYRIPPMLYFRRVVLSSALPQILAGVRVALPIGITVMVVSELFASTRGLGYYILNASQTFKVPETWAGALIVGIIGYLITLLFIVIERRILSWYFRSAGK
ncbi:MAG TPA: ABC transporter permease [Actinomycetales bacterium]|nr:ABC transporter permease [Actinomycetales bacterium]